MISDIISLIDVRQSKYAPRRFVTSASAIPLSAGFDHMNSSRRNLGFPFASDNRAATLDFKKKESGVRHSRVEHFKSQPGFLCSPKLENSKGWRSGCGMENVLAKQTNGKAVVGRPISKRSETKMEIAQFIRSTHASASSFARMDLRPPPRLT